MFTAQRRAHLAALGSIGYAVGSVPTGSVFWRQLATGWKGVAEVRCDGAGRPPSPLAELITGWAQALDLWPCLARCRFDRAVARLGVPGWPAVEPTGDYSMMLLMRRSGVVGGAVRLRDRAMPGAGPVHQVLLTRPGQYLVVDDRRLRHETTRIAVAGRSTATAGCRDVVVASFTRL